MISSFSELKAKSKSKDSEQDKIQRTVIVKNFQVTLMCDKLTGKPKT